MSMEIERGQVYFLRDWIYYLYVNVIYNIYIFIYFLY